MSILKERYIPIKNETIVYGENYKYKYKEVENISKQMSKELKHYNLKNKVSYKKFLNE